MQTNVIALLFSFDFFSPLLFLELELQDGAQLIVADVTSPNSIEFHLKLHASMDT